MQAINAMPGDEGQVGHEDRESDEGNAGHEGHERDERDEGHERDKRDEGDGGDEGQVRDERDEGDEDELVWKRFWHGKRNGWKLTRVMRMGVLFVDDGGLVTEFWIPDMAYMHPEEAREAMRATYCKTEWHETWCGKWAGAWCDWTLRSLTHDAGGWVSEVWVGILR
jgi:hypothetical protein